MDKPEINDWTKDIEKDKISTNDKIIQNTLKLKQCIRYDIQQHSIQHENNLACMNVTTTMHLFSYNQVDCEKHLVLSPNIKLAYPSLTDLKRI